MSKCVIGKDCIGIGVGALIFNEDGKMLLALRGKKAKNEPEKCDRIGWFSVEEAEKMPLSIVTQHDIKVLKERS